MITYRVDASLSAAQYIDLLKRSTLGARRPIDDHRAIQTMLEKADILVTAWDDDLLVGVARSLSDRSYVTYLADLAVDVAYQRQGIGKRLIAQTQAQAEPTCKICLFAAPAAETYYGKIGFAPHPKGWLLAGDARVT